MSEKPSSEGDSTDKAPPTGAEPTPPRRLMRSRDDRVIAGVAGGIAEYLNIDPTLVRLGFAASVFFGGLGVVVYLVLALVAPVDDGHGRSLPRERPSTWIVIAALIAILIVLPSPLWGIFGGGGWWWGWGFGWLLAVSLVVAAAYLLLRRRDSRRERESGGSEPSPANEPDAGEPDAGEPSGPPSTHAATALGAEAPTAALPAASASGAPPGGGAGGSGTEDEGPRLGGPHPVVRVLAIVVLAIVAIFAAASIALVSAWGVATGHGGIVAGTVIALGVVLIASALTRRAAAWLVVPALVIGVPGAAVAASDIRFDGGVGNREYSPSTAMDIPANGYSLGVGQLIVDLRQLPWRRGDAVELRSDLGVGQSVILIPPRVCLQAEATGTAGELVVRGQRTDGVDLRLGEDPGPSPAPRLVLDAEIELGQLVVTSLDPDAVVGRDHDWGDTSDDQQERSEQRAACASR